MITTIIFDLGGVLIDWKPEYLYTNIFADEMEMRHFLDTVCSGDWNEEQDAGRTIKEGTDFLVSQFPDHEENIKAYYGRWEEMLGGAIGETVEIFKELKSAEKYKIYALTNWSEETFPIAQRKFDFLNWFDGIVVSGTERMRKPDPSFYQLILDRYQLPADEVLFIDDNLRNIKAALEMGIDSIHFTSPEELRIELEERGGL
ncbi:HAD family phosphatase [Pedobacter sp. P351]|uniref:HAD family hydrolase n=1 Tax=Pedobacter superstes TaxID=3133441 RepID=UPI0030A7096B